MHRFPSGIECVAVLDGHGESEETITHCLKRLPSLLKNIVPKNSERHVRKAFSTLFDETAAFKDGCTLSLAVLFDNGNAVVASLGDSPVVWGYANAKGTSVSLLPSHDVYANARERQRLRKLGDTLRRGYVKNPQGNMLAVSRALGNKSFRGLISGEPEVTSIVIPPGGYLMLATDGFLDFSIPEQWWMGWLAYVEEKLSATEMLKRSFHRLRGKGDDATVVVCYR